ncbi:Xaa-Pro aminopeptidase [Thermosyntropha lipolytica DSM 11003]|uniref:Xaa-Pro aminopeptidase n=2 Tax=Thermosyntropha TaxID=54293 RepID=A0A1M5LLU8_9FIRM|nr:Xaa-Pro aminopeptidase [Thermosyntropha lipolytica DSM 11003]
MKEKGLNAFLVSKPENIRYLSGFTGGEDAKLLILEDEQYIITDTRYREQAAREAPHFELLLDKFPYLEALNKVRRSCWDRLGIESLHLTYHEYRMLESTLDVDLFPLEYEVEELRMVKEEEELECIREAARIGDMVFEEIVSFLKPGITEKKIADRIAFLLREKGCAKEAFDVIAAAGENASLPHARPGEKAVKPGEMLILDYGGFYEGYAADMTRTVFIGSPSAYFQDAYREVLKAQKIGISVVRAGIKASKVDEAVRDYLKSSGLGDYFVHSTGHGLGLEIHEKPALSPAGDIELKENMVVTIEPGIYIPGKGGIRIEDTVIVKKDGCEIITRTDKELRIIF